MVTFADTVPSLRIAVDLKLELFRNIAKPWRMSAIHDIDALSMAVPRQRDDEPAIPFARQRAPRGTKIIASLATLPDALPPMVEQARNTSGDRTGWDWAGPWDGYCMDWDTLIESVRRQPPAPQIPAESPGIPGQPSSWLRARSGVCGRRLRGR
jgi:hypothetical protein